MMAPNEIFPINTPNHGVITWKHGDSPLPNWVSARIIGTIEPNGTFLFETNLGRVRVHIGNVIIDRNGQTWVVQAEDAINFIDQLKFGDSLPLETIGPGKVRQFGLAQRTTPKKGKGRRRTVENEPRYAPPVGSQPTIEWIHLNKLSVDSAYQRSTDNETSRRLIASIAARFDWRLCAPLVVSRRPNALTIIDGQHRWSAASKRHDIPQLPCCVFTYETREEEARMFILANRARKPINRLDDYYAALAAADEDALEMHQLVTDAGLRIARNTSSAVWQPGEITFTASIAAAIRKFGPAITSAALTSLAEAFPGQKMTHGGAIFGSLVLIMSRPVSDFDPDRLLSVLQTRTADEWGSVSTKLRGGDTRIAALHDEIMLAYRKNQTDTASGRNR